MKKLLTLIFIFLFQAKVFAQDIILVNKVYFSGNSELTDQELRRLSPLRQGVEFSKDLAKLAVEKISNEYQKRGYQKVEVELQSSVYDDVIKANYLFNIKEGRRSKIKEINIDGEIPEEAERNVNKIVKAYLDEYASRDKLKELKRDLYTSLRREGYLQTFIDVNEGADVNADSVLDIKIDANDPISINFEGNSFFSVDELLQPLKLESRTVPFSPSAIRNLVKEIVQLYQESGYYHAQVSYSELPAQGKRKIYLLKIIEGPKIRIDDIKIRGNNALSTSEIRELINTKEQDWLFLKHWQPGYLVQSVLLQDVINIENLYAQNGYPGTKVNYLLENKEGNTLDLTFDIAEAKIQYVKKVEIEKNLVETDDFSDKLKLKIVEGVGYSDILVQEEEESILQFLLSKGYLSAKVEVSELSDDGVIKILITPGYKVKIGKIILRGNILVSKKNIYKSVRFKKGKTLTLRKIKETETSLYRLGFFSNVDIQPADGKYDSSEEDVLISLVERDTGFTQIGVTVNTEDGLHLQSSLGQRNLFNTGNALTFSVDGFINKSKSILDAGFMRSRYYVPNFLSSTFDFYTEVFGQFAIDLIDPYSFNRAGFTTATKKELRENFLFSLSYTSFIEQLFDVPTDVKLSPDDGGDGRFGFISTQFDWDLRDNSYNPRKGYKSSLLFKLASQAIASDVNYAGVTFQQSAYFELTRRLVWANSFTANMLSPYGNTDIIPLSQRIFLGGRDSLRGYSKYAIGPRGEDGHIVGGDESLNLKSELQYDLSESIVGLFFVDVGQAFLNKQGDFQGEATEIRDLRYSPGLGLRYKTPIGPLSIEYGFAIDKENGERFGRFNFGIGSGF
ncbi:MAG: outer membrane protein assembly factor BamA [Proteobacteria bacterium]|nr:outer membrane protein assembly factor BamA [Pseudomonadota bacterium]